MAKVDDLLDGWLNQMDDQPMMRNLSDDDQARVELIVTIVVSVAVAGYGKQVDEWNQDLLADVFFNRFVPLLEENEKELALFALIPTAMSLFFKVVKPARVDELSAWVKDHHNQLVNLYDAKADQFYTKLTTAMKHAGIDLTDQMAVGRYTKQYLQQHPQEGKQLFTKKFGK